VESWLPGFQFPSRALLSAPRSPQNSRLFFRRLSAAFRFWKSPVQLFLGSSSLWRTISVALISGAVSVAGFKKCVLCVESSGVVL
jgi:hypothetical protein